MMSWIFRGILWIISQQGGSSTKKKDLMSCLCLIEIVVIIGICIAMLTPYFESIVDMAVRLEKLFSNLQQGIYSNVFLDVEFNFNLSDFFKLFLLFLILSVFMIIAIYLKIKRSKIIFAYIIVQVFVATILFPKAGLTVLLFAVCLFLISIFIPIGSGEYFDIIKYLCYFPESYKEEKDKKGGLFFWIKIITGAVLFIVLAKILIPYFSLLLLTIVCFSLIILVFIFSIKEKEKILIRKVFLYTIFAIIILLNNNSYSGSIVGIALAMISIFFAIDRIVSSIKDYKNVVKSESLGYLIDEINDDESLIKEKLDVLKIEKPELTEKTLLRQIVIHTKLNLLEEACRLIQIYRELEYKNQIKLVDSIECLIKMNPEDSIEEQEKTLKKVWESKNAGIEYIPLSIQYAYVLFLGKGDYNRIIEILEKHWLYIDDEYKYILYYAYVETKKYAAAENVKKEICNFSQIEEEIKNLLRNEDFR